MSLTQLSTTLGAIFSRRDRRRNKWSKWHHAYDANQHLKARLDAVRQTIRSILDGRPAGRICIISVCAGDGRDILQVIADHPRRHDIEAWLIDSDAPSRLRAEATVTQLGLQHQVHFRADDAGAGSSYRNIAPADILLLSGFLGRLNFAELTHLIGCIPSLCGTGTDILWTRHLSGNGGVDISQVQDLWRAHQFDEIFFSVASANGYAVAWQRFAGIPQPLAPNLKLFQSVPFEIVRPNGFAQSRDSAIGVLHFDHGHWTTTYNWSGSQRSIEIKLHSTERGPIEGEILAVQQFLNRLPEHAKAFRRSGLLTWSYFPQRITAQRNGDIEVRYRSRWRFLRGKRQRVPRADTTD